METGFIIAASADIFCRVTVLPAAISTMATCATPSTVSQTVMNLSDSKEQEPNLILSALIDNGGPVSYWKFRGKKFQKYKKLE